MEHALVPLLLLLVGLGMAYQVVSAVAALKFGRSKGPGGLGLPPVTILKPVRGLDSQAWENFASFCRQDYPEYQIVFGVQDSQDPAIELIRRLQTEFPDRDIQLVVSGDRIGSNLKVCNLANMLSSARHELLVISDSDMRVRSDYLRLITPYFNDPGVGMVTSPYIGIGAHTLGARLEALGMATDFFPGVAVATQFANPAFGLGSTLALTKATLGEIGGLEGLADYLADDFQMGNRVAKSGKRVVLSRYVVDTTIPNTGIRQMLDRRLRWMRTARTCEPKGFAGSVVTFPTFWALLLLPAAHLHLWAVAVLAGQQAVRCAVAAIVGCGVLRSRETARSFWLLPFSDLLCFGLWLGSWCGNTIRWRGDRFRLTEGGLMVPLTTPEPMPSIVTTSPPAPKPLESGRLGGPAS